MKILIFGYGLHGGGFDCARYFLERGDEIRITDIRSRETLGGSIDYLERKGAVIHCGGHMTDDFQWADVVIKAPSIRSNNEFLHYAKKVENDISFISTRPEVKNIKIICVTGSSNKSTTASAICHALNKLGCKAHMFGNMGNSAFSEVRRWNEGDIPEYIVIELSTWLARDTYTFMNGKVPQVKASVITSIFSQNDTSNPTDQANSANEANADILVTGEYNIHSDYIICPQEVKEKINKRASKKAKKITTIESTSKTMSKSLSERMQPSFAVLKTLGFSTGQINKALKSYKGIPHRNELVARTGCTMFINDSSSIMPAAVNFAMENFESLLVHLICGGSDGSQDPQPMLKALKTAASVYLLDGSFTREKLMPMLEKNEIMYHGPYEKMEEAILVASSKLNQESNIMQVVLLSPGAMAFESFGTEHDRGDAFKIAVNQLVHQDSLSI